VLRFRTAVEGEGEKGSVTRSSTGGRLKRGVDLERGRDGERARDGNVDGGRCCCCLICGLCVLESIHSNTAAAGDVNIRSTKGVCGPKSRRVLPASSFQLSPHLILLDYNYLSNPLLFIKSTIPQIHCGRCSGKSYALW